MIRWTNLLYVQKKRAVTAKREILCMMGGAINQTWSLQQISKNPTGCIAHKLFILASLTLMHKQIEYQSIKYQFTVIYIQLKWYYQLLLLTVVSTDSLFKYIIYIVAVEWAKPYRVDSYYIVLWVLRYMLMICY